MPSRFHAVSYKSRKVVDSFHTKVGFVYSKISRSVCCGRRLSCQCVCLAQCDCARFSYCSALASSQPVDQRESVFPGWPVLCTLGLLFIVIFAVFAVVAGTRLQGGGGRRRSRGGGLATTLSVEASDIDCFCTFQRDEATFCTCSTHLPVVWGHQWVPVV